MRAERPSRDYYRMSALASCVASHLVAYLQFWLAFPGLSLPPQWFDQFIVLLGLSLAAGILQYALSRRDLVPSLILCLRILFVFVAIYPLGSQVTIRVTLIAALVFEVMIYLEPPASYLASGALVVVTMLLQRPVLAWEDQTARVSLDSLLFLGFYPLVVMTLGAFLKQSQRMAAERKRLLDRLKQASTNLVETNLTLQEHILSGEEHTRLLERQHISRELHDTIGYTLMNIIAMIKASVELSRSDVPRMREFLDQTVTQAQQGLAETRSALRAMRDAAPRRPSLVAAVNRLAGAFRDTPIKVAAVFSNVPGSFGEEIDAAVYRMVQEAIANAIRHGNATAITIYLALDGERINVTVDDNGIGAAELKEGSGISGIRERLRRLGGELEAGNAAAGFRLHARIPHAAG